MRVIAIDTLKREIEKRFCDGCSSKDYEEFKAGYCCEMVEDTMNFIDTLPTTESESDKDWISVKDRLPDDDVRLIDANSVCKKIVKSIRCAEEWANEAKKQQDTHGLRCATEAQTSLLAMLARIHDEPTIEAEPCTFCAYNPPSSGDGKPCTVCPAVAKKG